MLARRKGESRIAMRLNLRNANGTVRSQLPQGMMALAVLALGLVALSAAMPAAAAGNSTVKDDNKWYQCQSGYLLVSTTEWPVEVHSYYLYDRNGDGFVCALPP